jgi:hypothetical protein
MRQFLPRSISSLIFYHPASFFTNRAHSSKGGQGMTPRTFLTDQSSDECSKLVTTIVSTFTAYYVHLWASFFPETPLSAPLPSFDGRAVHYPSVQNLRDYMSWRQVDCELFLATSEGPTTDFAKVTSIIFTTRHFGP